MELKFDIRSNGAAVIRAFSDLQKRHLPKAHVEAANNAGRYVHGALRLEMQQVFDRPTPWALRGLRYKLATERAPLVRIWLEEAPNKGIPPAVFLSPQIKGGPRRHKSFERALITRGLMKPEQFAVPGAFAPLDAHGNVGGSFITRILSDLQAFGESGHGVNRKGRRTGRRKRNYFFVPRPGHTLRPGVYLHLPNGLVGLVFAFVRQPSYAKRFDFYGVGQRAYERRAARFLAEAMARRVRGDNRG
jgi:hypothetical protein